MGLDPTVTGRWSRWRSNGISGIAIRCPRFEKVSLFLVFLVLQGNEALELVQHVTIAAIDHLVLVRLCNPNTQLLAVCDINHSTEHRDHLKCHLFEGIFIS